MWRDARHDVRGDHAANIERKEKEDELSNVQAVKQDMDNLARLQQMKINTRLTALQAVQTLMNTRGYLELDGGGQVNKVDAVTLLATAQMIEEYILGNIEKETIDAMEAAKLKMDPNRPRIVRP